MKQWVIMGDYEKIGSALVCVLPRGCDETNAKQIAKRMNLNPSHVDRLMIAKDAQIIHVDIDPCSINKNVKVDIPIIGDAKNVWAEEIEADEAWWNDNCD